MIRARKNTGRSRIAHKRFAKPEIEVHVCDWLRDIWEITASGKGDVTTCCESPGFKSGFIGITLHRSHEACATSHHSRDMQVGREHYQVRIGSHRENTFFAREAKPSRGENSHHSDGIHQRHAQRD